MAEPCYFSEQDAPRHRKAYIIMIILISSLFLASLLTFTFMHYFSNKNYLSMDSLEGMQDENIAPLDPPSSGYWVRSANSRLPYISNLDRDAIKIEHERLNKSKSYKKRPRLVKLRDSKLELDENIWRLYYIRYKNVFCYYHEGKIDEQGKLSFNTDIHYISEPVISEFINVFCKGRKKYKESVFYEDIFFTVKINKERKKRITKTGQLSVLILGMSSVSRRDFYRRMPKTALILKKVAIDMKGYHVVKNSEHSNMIAAFAGSTTMEYDERREDQSIIESPFIWKLFRDNKYIMINGENNCTRSIFDGEKDDKSMFLGEDRLQWDYSYYSFCHVKENKHNALTSFMDLLKYTRQVAFKLKSNPYFAMFWEKSASSSVDYAEFVDEKYRELLESLIDTKILNNTLMIVMSSGGESMTSELVNTNVGMLERVRPFMFLKYPEWWQEANYDLFQKISVNAERLTTPYDFYKTILALLPAYEVQNSLTNGISWYNPISLDRTCNLAGIEKSVCSALEKKDVNLSEDEKKKIRETFVNLYNRINKGKYAYEQFKIIEPTSLWTFVGDMVNDQIWKEFDVELTTASGVHLQAVVRILENDSIQRLYIL